MENKINNIWALLRILLGFIFLWAFLDKLIGLGFSTAKEKAWILGGSPTLGFLINSAGPLSSFYNSIAGHPATNILFMLGLLLIGLSLILGIGIKIASYSGILLMFLMWTAVLPPANNPIIDDHIIYIFVLIGVLISNAGRYYGLGLRWSKLKLVKKNKWLE